MLQVFSATVVAAALVMAPPTTEPVDDCPPPELAQPEEGRLLTLEEGRHRDMMARAVRAANGESVEIRRGMFVTVTDAHQAEVVDEYGNALVAVHVAYENFNADYAMLGYSIVCAGTTTTQGGLSYNNNDEHALRFTGALPGGTADEATLFVYLPSRAYPEQTCDGPAWFRVSDMGGVNSVVWPVCGNVVG